MKNISFFIGFAIATITLTFCKNSDKASFIIPIEDYSNKEVKIDINDQTDRDVRVFKTWFMDDGYKVVMFHDYSGELQQYECFYGTEEIFSEANLSWKNDTTLIVTLINTDLNNKISFEFFGNGSSSGMRWDEEKNFN